MVIFDSTVSNVNRISPCFGKDVLPIPTPAPVPKLTVTPRPARSAVYWDAETQTYIDPIASADREWWAAESNAPAQAEEHAARLDAHYAMLYAEWQAKEALMEEAARYGWA